MGKKEEGKKIIEEEKKGLERIKDMVERREKERVQE